jgi:hypothetical protein
MKQSSVLHSFSVLSLAVFGACEMSSTPEEDEVLATSAQTLNVTYDLDYLAAPITRTWDSGKTTHLSGYNSALCPANFGGERLIVKFVSHRESNSLDNYPARLSAVCRRYGADQGGISYAVADLPPDDDTLLLYSVNYLSGAMATEVSPSGNGERVPVGIRLQVNPNEYVKDIQIHYRSSYTFGLGTRFTTPVMTGLTGTDEDLECPTDYAMTGVRVKHSTDSGKLRVFQIECHRLVQ